MSAHRCDNEPQEKAGGKVGNKAGSSPLDKISILFIPETEGGQKKGRVDQRRVF